MAASSRHHVRTSLLRALAALLVALWCLAPGLAPAAGVLLAGDQTLRTFKDSDPAGTAEAFKTTAVASGTVGSITLYVDATAPTKLTVGLYAANGTHPGALLTQGTLNAPVGGAWNEVPVPAATVTSGTTYWIAVLSPSGTGTLRYRDTANGTSGSSETSSQTTLTALPTTWSTGKSFPNAPLSAFVSAASGPVLAISPTTLTFSATAGGSDPAPASVAISNTGTGTLSYTAASDAPWLTASPSSGTAPQSVQVSASIAGLSAGTYTGHVTITATGATASPQTVTVTLNVAAPPTPILAVTPTSLSFSAVAGGSNPAPASLSVKNSGTGTLTYTVGSDAAWLIASPASGTAPGTVQVSASIAGLAAGVYTGHVTITATGVQGSPAVVTVTLNVGAPAPVLSVSPATLSFTAVAGGSNPAPASLNVTNTGTGTLSFTAASDAGWLTVTPTSGSAPQTLQVNASTIAQEGFPLAAGTYTGHITVTATGAQNSPTVITVTLTITQPILTVSPLTLTFNGVAGGANPASAPVSITNTGAGTLNYNVTSDMPWLTAAPAIGTAPQTVQVSASTSGLAPGSYIGHLTVTATGAQNSPAVITVTLNVTQPVLSVTPTSLTFNGTAGGANPAASSLSISNTGTGTLAFTASADVAWLTVTPASGNAPATLQVAPAISGLAAGTYTGHVIITSAGAQGSPASIPVTLNLAQPSGPGATLLGTQTVGTNADSNAAGQAEAFKITATASGTMTSMTVYVDSGSSATKLVVGLYANNGTHPGALLTQGTLNAPVAAAWNIVQVPPVAVTSGTVYWIAVLGPSGAGTLKFRDTTTGAATETSLSSALTTLPATWATGATYANAPVSVYGSAAAGALLSVTPGTISFSTKAGGADPLPVNVSVANAGGGTLSFTTSSDASWLTATPTSGSAPQTLQVAASVASLPAGNYTGHLTVTSTGTQGSPAVVTATLALIGPPARIALTPATATVSANKTVSYTATILDASGNVVADATNAVTFSVSNVTGTFNPATPVTPSGGQASVTFTPTTSGTATITAASAGLASGTATLNVLPSNAITLENQKPGSSGWPITNAVSTTTPEILGYAAATSVNVGGTLPLMISLSASGQYTVDVYRLGWYGGLGGRLVYSSGTLSGVTQAPCSVTDTTTRLIECNWNVSLTLQTTSDWTTGLYVANLTARASGKQSQIWFVVRDDSSLSDVVFQSAFTTFQAYNNFGTTEQRSLSAFNSTNGVAAYKVSFDRPFAQVSISPGEYNKMTRYEYNMVRWMESQGYDVSYLTNIDVHLNPALLLQHKVYLSVGHDEYWSLEMRNAVEQARDSAQKVNLGFFSANTAYWRVRLEASTAGVPNRVMVCYKDASIDPQNTTGLWRDPPNNRPENAMIGVMYVGDNSYDPLGGADFIVTNTADPYYANTGLVNGTALSQLVGYEWDAVVNNGLTPPGLIMLSASTPTATTIAPSLPPGTNSNASNAVRYTAASGAKVFATGSIQWMWGLDSLNTSPARVDPRAQQMFVNVLGDMGARPLTPNAGLIIP